MSNWEGFYPDWTSAPGDTITDILEEQDMSKARFGRLVHLTADDVDELLRGQSTVTIGLARRLASVLGASVEFWMSRDYQYRQDSRWLQEGEDGWLRQLPLADMVKFDWLNPTPSPSGEFAACLGFFGVETVSEWQEKYRSLAETAAFRSSPSFVSTHGAIAAWLRRGEIEAEQIECRPWHPEGFQESLNQIRALTFQKDPNRFIPVLQEACSTNGVAVVIVRSPSGCRASGATRFVSSNKAILQLSFRYLTDDHFWFSFFHEAGHLLMHGLRHYFSATLEFQRPWILESANSPANNEEQEANEFAEDILIPKESQSELLSLPIQRRAIIRFAHRVGVSPGVIVGQLQHSGRIGHDQMNGLKRRFEWRD